MVNVLFRQSDVENPYSIYDQMLREQPVYFDSGNNIRALYSYAACQQVLNSEFTFIPNPNASVMDRMSASARLIADLLVRLQNPPKHEATRPIVLRLVDQMLPMDILALLDAILTHQERAFDWVEMIARRLPAQALLASFGFSSDETERLLDLLDSLVKIMLPGKSEEVLRIVNAAADEAYPLVEQHITGTGNLRVLVESENVLQVMTANLIGLLIQGYDAGRGLLSNALLQYTRQAKQSTNYNGLVVETLRYDPPVQNTKRILTQNLVVNDTEIKAGEAVLLVLAAANRDPQHFTNPTQFDPLRRNNSEHLTFGAGIHECLARHFIVKLVAETMDYLSNRCPNLRIVTEQIEYEPLINVRVPRTIQIAF